MAEGRRIRHRSLGVGRDHGGGYPGEEGPVPAPFTLRLLQRHLRMERPHPMCWTKRMTCFSTPDKRSSKPPPLYTASDSWTSDGTYPVMPGTFRLHESRAPTGRLTYSTRSTRPEGISRAASASLGSPVEGIAILRPYGRRDGVRLR